MSPLTCSNCQDLENLLWAGRIASKCVSSVVDLVSTHVAEFICIQHVSRAPATGARLNRSLREDPQVRARPVVAIPSYVEPLTWTK